MTARWEINSSSSPLGRCWRSTTSPVRTTATVPSLALTVWNIVRPKTRPEVCSRRRPAGGFPVVGRDAGSVAAARPASGLCRARGGLGRRSGGRAPGRPAWPGPRGSWRCRGHPAGRCPRRRSVECAPPPRPSPTYAPRCAWRRRRAARPWRPQSTPLSTLLWLAPMLGRIPGRRPGRDPYQRARFAVSVARSNSILTGPSSMTTSVDSWVQVDADFARITSFSLGAWYCAEASTGHPRQAAAATTAAMA